jgi:Na+-translocating ferredoxin:NAD+ oxidoreductase subunit B
MARQADWLPYIAQDVCTGCGECIAICPTYALAQVEGKANLVYPDLCTYCSACESTCPVNAIDLPYLVVSTASHKQEE